MNHPMTEQPPHQEKKLRVLFLCTGNSCRSHMAEGLLRHLAGDRFTALSAGSNPSGYVHPKAIEVMNEVGISLEGHESESIQDYLAPEKMPDLVISVCDNAATDCPVFPGKVARLHWPFEDPAHAEGTEEEKKAFFVKVRDQIRDKIGNWLDEGAPC